MGLHQSSNRDISIDFPSNQNDLGKASVNDIVVGGKNDLQLSNAEIARVSLAAGRSLAHETSDGWAHSLF